MQIQLLVIALLAGSVSGQGFLSNIVSNVRPMVDVSREFGQQGASQISGLFGSGGTAQTSVDTTMKFGQNLANAGLNGVAGGVDALGKLQSQFVGQLEDAVGDAASGIDASTNSLKNLATGLAGSATGAISDLGRQGWGLESNAGGSLSGNLAGSGSSSGGLSNYFRYLPYLFGFGSSTGSGAGSSGQSGFGPGFGLGGQSGLGSSGSSGFGLGSLSNFGSGSGSGGQSVLGSTGSSGFGLGGQSGFGFGSLPSFGLGGKSGFGASGSLNGQSGFGSATGQASGSGSLDTSGGLGGKANFGFGGGSGASGGAGASADADFGLGNAGFGASGSLGTGGASYQTGFDLPNGSKGSFSGSLDTSNGLGASLGLSGQAGPLQGQASGQTSFGGRWFGR